MKKLILLLLVLLALPVAGQERQREAAERRVWAKRPGCPQPALERPPSPCNGAQAATGIFR